MGFIAHSHRNITASAVIGLRKLVGQGNLIFGGLGLLTSQRVDGREGGRRGRRCTDPLIAWE